jgi:hypothetical protein
MTHSNYRNQRNRRNGMHGNRSHGIRIRGNHHNGRPRPSAETQCRHAPCRTNGKWKG